MDFTKVQSVGNDFVLIEASKNKRDWSSLAKNICSRHFGVGADGLLVLFPSNDADFRMRIFNSDGTEAEACGNGLRCLVNYVHQKRIHSGDHMTVETMAGIRNAEIKVEGEGTKIRIGMGLPVFETSNIPVVVEKGQAKQICNMTTEYPLNVRDIQLSLSFVSMGNPHAVHFNNYPVTEFPLDVYGPLVENAAIFPVHTNFEVVRVIQPDKIEMRVWERGVGETLACGSGACAVAVASWILGYTGSKVDIKLPGGLLQAEWDGYNEVFLTGKAEIVFFGVWQQ
ncbi:MAG: diaminopimelate epimerase [Dehalogenimonas sp.]|uniref:Diaminopimelate epimerase n=1 Tax=Candidatus Dehalogenimonas loeffleri TaxID=3127115 RepID=A0ABZ2J2W2_9CHLR|nr:diaminopimelate epimerase [Dehalogenimonas sp.]